MTAENAPGPRKFFLTGKEIVRTPFARVTVLHLYYCVKTNMLLYIKERQKCHTFWLSNHPIGFYCFDVHLRTLRFVILHYPASWYLICSVKIGAEFAMGGEGGGSRRSPLLASPIIAIMIGVSRNCLGTNLKFERPEIMLQRTVTIEQDIHLQICLN